MALFVVVVLLLVIVPALIYLVGWAAMRYTGEPPGWIGFPVRRDPADKPGGEPPAPAKE